MRKDVKLGMAIGAVLLSVIVVYIAAVSDRSGVEASGDVSVAVTQTPGLEPPALIEVGPTFAEPAAPAATITQTPVRPAPETSAVASVEPDWGRLLDTPPSLMGETPTPRTNAMPQATRTVAAVAPIATPTPAERVSPTPPAALAVATPEVAMPTRPSGSSVAAASTMPRTYTVRQGDSLYTIAQAVYGNGGQFNAIERANPSVRPNALRPGSTLIIPDLASPVQPKVQPTASAAGASTAYTVREGDTLYRISSQIFGSPNRAQDIYSLNRTAIGSDPGRLRVGMVLKLPSVGGN